MRPQGPLDRERSPSSRGAPWRAALLRAAALVAAVASAGCMRDGGAPHDVVLIVIDTLRADHLPLYGYDRATSSALDRIAAEAVTYERAISPSTWTTPAHGSLFTGRWPSFHGAERVELDPVLATPLSTDTPTLAELLRGQGFHTAAFVANAAYVARVLGFDRGFDEFADDRLERAPAIVEAVRRWLPHQTERFFLFINILDPHEPYDPPPPYDGRFPGKRPEFGTTMTTSLTCGMDPPPAMVAHFVSQYDGEIVMADAAIGEIVAALREAGRYDDALVIVTSDHGELFGEHGLAGHGQLPFEGLVHVPLIVKYPAGARRGERVGRRVSTLAVFATILDALGIAAPPDTQARRLDDPHPVWVEDVHWEWGRVRAGYDGTRKAVTAQATGETVWSYDLARDPFEDRPVPDDPPSEALATALAAFSRAPRPVHMATGAPIDPEREAKLRALGYLR